MGVPKRKTSHARKRNRQGAVRFRAGQLSKCSQCGSALRPHRVCPSCGYYHGRQVISSEVS